MVMLKKNNKTDCHLFMALTAKNTDAVTSLGMMGSTLPSTEVQYIIAKVSDELTVAVIVAVRFLNISTQWNKKITQINIME